MRPRQWLKNLALFAAIVFTGQLFNRGLLWLSFRGFVVFCLLSSASYLINDLLDIKGDRLHPFKRLRPIALGLISKKQVVLVASSFLSLATVLSLTISAPFFFVVVLYIFLHLSYSFFLKHIAVIDILTIASAYILRVYAGEVVTGFHLSVWLMLTVISLSLFLAIGKRRCELTLLQRQKGISPAEARSTLGHYNERLLDVYTSIFANSTWLTYAFYTFLVDRPQAHSFLFGSFLKEFLPEVAERKWLMLTIPFVIYGLMRYMLLIYEKAQGESPERVLLSDKPLLLTVILWGMSVVLVIYGIGS